MRVEIYTDGSCFPNPGPGGWSAILVCGSHEKELSGGEKLTTNNRMELTAACIALESLKHHCEVALYTDSQYLQKGISEWLPKWVHKNWVTAIGTPVKNQDLWQRLYTAAFMHKIDWKWLRGHAGHAYNERCDRLAGEARRQICRAG